MFWIKFSKKKILSIFISIISTFFLFQILLLFDFNIQKYITEFLPSGYLNKISSFSLSNIDSLPRFDIWSKSISLINQNLFFGYGAGSFPKIYSMSDGNFVGIQHTHNIFLELTFNHGMPVALIILFTMIIILISALKIYRIQNKYQHASSIDKAWIISFTNFLIIHLFDITYFDGRISILCWTLLAGLRSISLNKE